MADTDDDIPVLTDAIERVPASSSALPGGDLDDLEAELCARSLRLAEERLREALREAEHILTEDVMNALRAELPGIVRRALREHFDK